MNATKKKQVYGKGGGRKTGSECAAVKTRNTCLSYSLTDIDLSPFFHKHSLMWVVSETLTWCWESNNPCPQRLRLRCLLESSHSSLLETFNFQEFCKTFVKHSHY